MSRTEAVDALYQDMAARHRARFRSIHVWLSSSLQVPVQRIDMLATTDPQGRRAGEDRRCQAPLRQAITFQESQIPSSSPCAQSYNQGYILRSPTCYICLGHGRRVRETLKSGGKKNLRHHNTSKWICGLFQQASSSFDSLFIAIDKCKKSIDDSNVHRPFH